MIIDFNRYNGGGSGSGSTDLTNYWNSAVTEQHIESAATEVYSSAVSYTDAALAGKADAKILVDFDHTPQSERAALYATLKSLYDGGSGATINKNYDFYKTVNTWQGLKIDYYGFSGDTMVFGKVVSPENTQDQVVYEQVMTIDSAGTVNVVTNSVGGGPDLSAYYTSAQTDEKIASAVTPVAEHLAEVEQITASACTELHDNILELSARTVDLSGYYTSGQTEDAISAATSGKADAANVQANTNQNRFPIWNEQGIITGTQELASNVATRINGTEFNPLVTGSNYTIPPFFAPQSAGTAGEILVSTGNGAPVWSAVTMGGNSNILAAISSQTEYEAISGSVKTGDLIQVYGVDINDDGEPEYGLFANACEGEICWERRDNADSIKWADRDYPWMADNDVFPIDLGQNSFLISEGDGEYNGIGFDRDGNPVITRIVPEYDDQTGEVTGMTREDTPIGGQKKYAYVVAGYTGDGELDDEQVRETFFASDDNIAINLYGVDDIDIADTNVDYTFSESVPAYANWDSRFTIVPEQEIAYLENIPAGTYHLAYWRDILEEEEEEEEYDVPVRIYVWVQEEGGYVEREYDHTMGEEIPGAVNNDHILIAQGASPDEPYSFDWTFLKDVKRFELINDNGILGYRIEYEDSIDTLDQVVSQALVDLNDRIDDISDATQDMVTSTDVRHMVKLTQAEYDQLVLDDEADPETFYIIVNSN